MTTNCAHPKHPTAHVRIEPERLLSKPVRRVGKKAGTLASAEFDSSGALLSLLFKEPGL